MSEKPAHDAPVAWTPPPPEHLEAMLPQYDQWEMIGCGGMGAVYKARQISLDRPVAIKVLPPQVAADEADYIARFKNEARTMAKMNHPAIVSVYDFGATTDGLLYFVMEYIDGTDVFKMIQAQRRLPVEHALAITAHVCDALAYAHEHKVIHRDIKPANILINMDGAVKVADFGLSSIHDPAQDSGTTQEGATMGTPDYVAPEVLTIGMTVDGRADLYAVGVMLYNMLTGKIPRGTFQMPSERIGCDKRYDAIVRKAMEPDPDRRYQTARELRRDLDQILTVPVAREKPASTSASAPAGQPLRGMLPRPLPPPPPPPRTPWGMIAAALIVIGGAAVLLTVGGRSSSESEAATDNPAKQKPPSSFSAPPTPESAPPASPPVLSAGSLEFKGSPLSKLPVLPFNGHYYQIVGERMNQQNALKHAEVLGAHLATINSQAEQDWIDRTLAPYLKEVPQSMATLGGLREQGTWKWATGEPFDFTRWEKTTDPASNPGKDFALKITATSPDKAEWGTGYVTAARAFVLEWDDLPSKRPPRRVPPAPPPSPPPVAESEGAKQLHDLAASFRTAVERDALAVHRAALADLNTKYLAALDRALSAAMTAARLPEALALREEKQLITTQSPLPAEDAPDLPPSLKALRTTYRASLRPIDSARDTSLTALFTKYEAVLKAKQAEWTEAAKPDDARLAVERIASLPRERAALLNQAKSPSLQDAN